MKFIAVGDNCIDYYTDTNERFAGGNALNVAVYMKQLGYDAIYLGVVGDDANGEIIIKSLQKKGMDTSLVRMEKGDTAVTEVKLENGDRTFTSFNEGVFASFALQDEELEILKIFPYIHTAVGGKIESVLEKLHKHAKISYDFSTVEDISFALSVCKHIDYAFVSYEKDDTYIRHALQQMCEQGVQVAVATLGENGSLAFDSFTYYSYGIKEVEVVDTLGAGDSFIAGFMDAVARGENVQNCLARGADYASKTVQYIGAW